MGVEIGESLVMDPKNAAFPVPVTRRAGVFSFQELMMLDYPYFPDIRAPGLNPEAIITSGLPQVDAGLGFAHRTGRGKERPAGGSGAAEDFVRQLAVHLHGCDA